jgi:uncharacterized protein (DUF305 family)
MVMIRFFPARPSAVLLFSLTIAACGAATGSTSAGGVAPAGPDHASATPAEPVGFQADYPHTAADVAFMSGMIHHHAQAVLIAGWAPTHSASRSVQALCERIVVGQQDEIALASRWLRARREPVPDPAHAMHGMEHSAMMPGMLSPEQLARLDQVRGPDFDRLFLEYMIIHHQGAITMVDQLFASQGAGQDETVFRFASDVYADQTTEIRRMQGMLAALPAAGGTP